MQINEGQSPLEAVEKAATIRLRPIFMTSIALVVAMVPLLVATGAGAVSRFHKCPLCHDSRINNLE